MKIQFLFQEHRLFRLINTVFLACIIVFVFGESLAIKDSTAAKMLAVIGTAGMLIIFHDLLKQRTLWGILGVLLVVLCIVGIIGLQGSMKFAGSYLNWLVNKPDWNEEWLVYYGMVQICWVTGCCYLFQFIQEKDFRIKGVVGILLFGLLVYCMVVGKKVSSIGVICSVAYLIFILVEWTQRKWEKVRKQSVRAYMNWLLPVVLAYSVLLANMPVSDKPYDWKLIKTVKAEVEEAFTLLSQKFSQKDDDVEFKLSGFSKESELGNGIFSTDKKIMILNSSAPLKHNVYLGGKIFDAFDGKNWVASTKMYPDSAYLDTAAMLYAVNRYDSKYSGDYIHPVYLEMSYEYIKSNYLFVPSKVWRIEKIGEEVNVLEKEGSLLFDKKQDYGTTFYMNYYVTNAESDLYDVLPELELEPDEERLDKILTDLETRTGVELKPEELEQYEAFCNDNYLGNVVLSDEVNDYLSDILRDAESDIEKLRAIEEELASFAYTRQPGELPEHVTDAGSFLEYFLLESRQGYCTYFATAFTLLAQSQGIPARYVQGYCVPMQGNKEMTVTASMAHAWPEVYINNVGWVPFEPTPGYRMGQGVSWPKQKEVAAESGQQKNYYDRESEIEEMVNLSGNILEDTGQGINYMSTTEQLRKGVHVAGRIVLLILLAAVLFVLEERIRGRYRWLRMDEDKRYLFKVKQNLKLLTRMGMDRKNEETLTEYRERMQEQLPAGMQLQFVEDYEGILYGNKQVDAQMKEVLLKEQKELLKYLKEKSHLRYWVFVLIQDN